MNETNLGDWPNTREADDYHRQQQQANRQLQEDILDSWRIVLDHLPAEFPKILNEAIRFLEARVIGS